MTRDPASTLALAPSLTSASIRAEEGGEADQSDLSQWIVRARAGDAVAFEYLVQRYERLVLRTAQRMLANNEDAKDAAQEVFLRFYARLHLFQKNRDMIPWLYRLTVNICFDLLRKRKGGEQVPVNHLTQADSRPNPEQHMDEQERKNLLSAALAQRPPKERAALILRDLEGCTTAEVASILRSSEATVRSQISTGRIKIRQFLEARHGRLA